MGDGGVRGVTRWSAAVNAHVLRLTTKGGFITTAGCARYGLVDTWFAESGGRLGALLHR